MIRILYRRGQEQPVEYTFNDQATVGRESECSLQLADSEVSRHHATLVERGGNCYVVDKGSTNGTWIEGRRLEHNESVLVGPGQLVTMGGFVLELVPAAPEPTVDIPVRGGSRGGKTLMRAPDEPAGKRYLRDHLVEGFEDLALWPKEEQSLLVADVIRETHDVNTFRLVAPTPQLFRYLPGQFVGITVDIDGKPVKRSYSISSSPSRPHAIELTIKQIPGGLVSNWMAENVTPGSTLRVKGPAGKFSCLKHPGPKLLMLAAGSGVTPLMSMLRWITDTSAPVDVIMLYSIRSPVDFVFGRELESIAARYSNVRVIVTVTNDRMGMHGWTGLAERVDRATIGAVVPDLSEREVFLCGPKPFSDAMKVELAHLGLPKEQLHFESFGSGKGGPGPAPAPAASPAPSPSPSPSPAPAPAPRPGRAAAPVPPVMAPPEPGTEDLEPRTESLRVRKRQSVREELPRVSDRTPLPPSTPPTPPDAAPKAPETPPVGPKVRFTISGVDAVATGRETLLQEAEGMGLELPNSCREGQCGTCKTRLLKGEVDLPDDCDLEEDEIREGWIYICVAKPKTDVEIEA